MNSSGTGLATVHDVAELADVSPRTVSRAWANSGAVAPDTRRRIVLASRKLGYSPNLVARALAKGRTHTIGLLLQVVSGRYLNHKFIEAVADKALNLNFRVIIGTHQGEPQQEDLCIQDLLGHQVEGLVSCPCEDGSGRALQQLVKSRLPIVTVDSQSDLPFTDITVDREEGAYLQVKHLAEIGRRRIAFLTRGLEGGWTMNQRIRGYRRACKDYGIEFDDRMLLLDSNLHDEPFRGGKVSAQRLLDGGRTFDGLVAFCDRTAFGAMLVFSHARVRMPQDVAVIGFDDDPMAVDSQPSLSTIRQPRELGQMAVRLLVDQIEAGNGFAPGKRQNTKLVLKPQLVVRESTRLGTVD